jgi:hypothetical protein
MFGHNTNDQISQDQQSDAHVSLPDDTINDLTSSPALDPVDQPAGVPPVQHSDYIGGIDQTIQPPATPQEPAPTQDTPAFPPASDELGEPQSSTKSPVTMPVPTPIPPTAAHDDLLVIKQEALNSLSPLVHNLELKSEEKFKTLMMLIQASDNQTLVKEAYEAAQAIPDEKVRAQALLDVVNEINYFTHDKEDDKN